MFNDIQIIVLMPEQNDLYYLFHKIKFYLFYIYIYLFFYVIFNNDRSLSLDNNRSLTKLRVRQNKCMVTCTLSTNHLISIHVIIL